MAKSLRRFYGKPWLVFVLIAMAIMLPLLPPGHIMTLDMAFTPDIPMPEIGSSSFLFRYTLYLLNQVIPTPMIEKLIFFAILIFSGLGMYRLAEPIMSAQRKTDIVESWGAYVSGVLYMINPFTYDRFMSGQYSVLMGYALLPFFVKALLGFTEKPGRKTMLHMTALATAISIVSIHSLGSVAIITTFALIASAWRYRKDLEHFKSIAKYSLIAVAAFLVASSYWIVPFMTGNSSAGRAVKSFTISDQQAYATAGSGALGKLGNVIRLQGFWAEPKDLFLLPQDTIPAWGIITIGVWVLVWVGVEKMLRSGRRFETFILGGSATMAVSLAVAGIGKGLSGIAPILGGFREPQKFIGLLALAFAFFAAQGIPVTVRWFRSKGGEALAMASLCVILILPILWTPTMPWGFAGQLSPRHYPVEWAEIDEKLRQDTDDFKVLFLPWHLYMHFEFAGRIIVNPADDFFDKPIVVSNDPELKGSSLSDHDPLKRKLSQEILSRATDGTELGSKLATENIKYIIFAKESDADKYQYLRNQTDLKKIYESPSAELYLNTAWEER